MSRNPWLVRVCVGLYVVCMVGLLTGYMAVAGMELPAAGWVQGGAAVAPGVNVVRARLDRVKDGRALLPAAPMTLTVGGAPATLRSPKGGVWSGEVELPAGEDGPLEVALRAPLDEEEVLSGVGSVPRVSAPGIGPMVSRRQQESQPGTIGVTGESGEVKIAFMPSHGELVRGLPQRLFGRTTDAAGAPLECTIQVLKREGGVEGAEPPATWRTDSMGLGWIEISPISDVRMELEARCGEQSGRATWYLTTVPAQLALTMSTHAVKPGGSARGGVKTLARQGALWVEVAQGDVWRWSGAWAMGDGESELAATIPEQAAEGVLQIQVSQDMHDAGSAWEMRYVVVTPDGEARSAARVMARLLTQRDAARWGVWCAAMLERVEVATPDELALWLEVMLSELPPRFAAPTLWLHTVKGDQAKLDAWKAEARGWLFGAVALGMIVGMIALIGGVGTLAAQRTRRLRAFEAAELEEEAAGELTGGLDVLSTRVQSALIIGTLTLFGLCILMLLRLL